MADLVQTAANVAIMQASPTIRPAQAGEAITQGQAVYVHTDNKHYKCDADDSAAKAAAVGIAMTPAATNAYFLMLTAGKFNPGATVAVNKVYIVSDTAGGIKPIDDLTTGDFLTILGTGTATNTIDLRINATGVETPA